MQTEQPLILRQRLIEAVDETYHVIDFETIVEVLQTLESLPVTKEVLEATRLGRTVNEFRRKVNDEHLAKRAKALVKKWRNEVLPEDPPTLAPVPKSTAHFNGNSHLVSEGPGPGPGPEITPISPVKTEPQSQASSETCDAESTVLEVEADPEKPKQRRGRAKKKKYSLDERLAEKDAELMEQFIKAGLAKPGLPLPQLQPVPVPDKKIRLVAGDEQQSVSSPDTTTSGAPSGPQPSPSVASVVSPAPTEDEIVKNEIIEKYLKSQSELKSQMEQQYQDRLARNEFEDGAMEHYDDDEASRSSALQASTTASLSPDVIDAGLADNSPTSAARNDTSICTKSKKKARLKDSGNDDSDEPVSQTFETEEDILAKLPSIDPEILASYTNYVFDTSEPEFYPTPLPASTTNNNAKTQETELIQLATALTKNSTSSSFTPVASKVIVNNNNISAPTAISSLLSSTNKSSSVKHVLRRVVKKVKKVKEAKQKSIFDLSDEEDEDDDDDYEMEEVEDETLTVPMEVDSPSTSSSSVLLQDQHLGKSNELFSNGFMHSNGSKFNSSNINNEVSISQDVVDSSSFNEAKQTQEEEMQEEPQFVRTVEDSEVEALLTQQIVGLNGNYDKTGSFREFHETILLESYLGEDFHILPYTIIDF